MREDVNVRVAKESDLQFIDALQRKHARNVGWLATVILQKRIECGDILIAESVVRGPSSVAKNDTGTVTGPGSLPLTTDNCQLTKNPIGYCLGQDRYFKRDDVGIIYQMNIEPGHQRSLVGARLLKAQFEKSAYGCKLYCCWCAQDLAANRFWEAMGFVALAFRAGSDKKKGGRVHIFWQKRIRSGDVTTPYWFPSQTGAGALKENRIVLPIPPGTHWSDAKPMVLPEEEGSGQKAEGRKELEGKRERKPREAKLVMMRSMQFGRPTDKLQVVEKPKKEKVKKPKRKNDPRLVSAARELRDRWLEQVNAAGGERMLLGNGKYDVSKTLSDVEGSRQIEGGHVEEVPVDGAVRVKLIELEQVKALAA
jgi:hypothetical protein